MDINPNIFKQYDIRGIWEKEIFPETGYQIGLGMGTFLKQKNISTMTVGHDNRLSGEEITTEFIKGLRETGINVIDLGLSTTPLTYASWYLLDAPASVNITASHNAKEYNGFKAAANKVHFSTEEYQQIKDIIVNDKVQKSTTLGLYEKHDLWPKYIQRVTEGISLKKPVKIVLDCGNGTCSTSTGEVLEKIGCEVIKLFCDHDGSFPNHLPYPQKEDGYTELKKKVLENHADMGIAMDGDGDRFGIYDEKGQFVSNDLIGALISAAIAKEIPGVKTVFNISTSQRAIEHIEQAGGSVTLWKTGYPHIINKMKELNATVGNEIAGHFFFKDKYFGFDDGTYAAARFVEFYSNQEKTVSQLVEEMPMYLGTPEFRVASPNEEQRNKFTIIADIIQELKLQFPDVPAMDFDGIRMAFPDKSWLLLRNSNTEPLITGRLEAKTAERLEELKAFTVALLQKHDIHLDWSNPIAGH